MKVKVKELYFNIVARHIKRFKTAVAMEFAHRDCDWFNLIILLRNQFYVVVITLRHWLNHTVCYTIVAMVINVMLLNARCYY